VDSIQSELIFDYFNEGGKKNSGKKNKKEGRFK